MIAFLFCQTYLNPKPKLHTQQTGAQVASDCVSRVNARVGPSHYRRGLLVPFFFSFLAKTSAFFGVPFVHECGVPCVNPCYYFLGG